MASGKEGSEREERLNETGRIEEEPPATRKREEEKKEKNGGGGLN